MNVVLAQSFGIHFPGDTLDGMCLEDPPQFCLKGGNLGGQAFGTAALEVVRRSENIQLPRDAHGRPLTFDMIGRGGDQPVLRRREGRGLTWATEGRKARRRRRSSPRSVVWCSIH